MGFAELVGEMASAHVEELQGDLDQARYALRDARARSAELERRVVALESLLELADKSRPVRPAAKVTLHEAMVEVLRETPGGMLRAGDLASQINRRRLYRMRDGRPAEAQQIHARVGHYPHLFTREGTFITLVR